VKCNIHFKSTIEVPFGTPIPTMDDPALTQFVSNITEQKTYIIPQKDITFPTKRKIHKIKKIHRSYMNTNRPLDKWKDPNMKKLTQKNIDDIYNYYMKLSLRKHKIERIIKFI
jgi:hypothetical protein